MEIRNRRAKFEYIFLETYEAGIQLLGTEVKSLREGNANLRDAYCIFVNGELFVKNMFIAEYEKSSQFNHDTKRDRKLLLRKSELRKIGKRIKEKGLTLIPYRIYSGKRGLFKVEIVMGQGKKSYDKRESIKRRDAERELKRLEKWKT